MSLLDKLTAPGPKRLLALDGGGIRGVLTLGFIERIEALLRERHQRPDLRLCEYFDLIGGTSTGSIIASALAIGMEAAEIKAFYLDIGQQVFGKRKWRKWEAFFDIRPLEEQLEKVFGDLTLGSEGLKTGLCIVTKRADTGSTWPLNNHPRSKFYDHNKDWLLREVIRASTAAPTFFVPEKIDISKSQVGAFVDGGVSMANNPSLQLLLMATLKGYGFRWPTGENQLLLTSLGTGGWERRDDVDTVAEGKLWHWAKQVPAMLMEDANWQNQLLLQSVSRTPTPWHIDGEIGDLTEDLLIPQPLLTYLRYDARLEADALQSMGLGHLVPALEALRDMSDAEHRFDLATIGEKVAAAQIAPEHFPPAFNLA
jgi:patatin-like phospholipase/acyl hydrolase